jgi:hypothetical protein
MDKLRPIQIAEKYAEETGLDTVELNFSRGKDSLAAWCIFVEAGLKVIPIYFYMFPGLEFEERSLRYYEDRFKTSIHRLPHGFFQQLVRTGWYCDPLAFRSLCETGNLLRLRHNDDQVRDTLETLGRPEVFSAIAMKGFDSRSRMMFLHSQGDVNHATKKLYPMAHTNNAGVWAILKTHRMPVAQDYKDFGRSCDLYDYRYMTVVKAKYPRDYAKIMDLFPLAEAILWRAKCGIRANPQSAA